MEQIQPTLFKSVNANEIPNAEQLLCGKALDAVIALDLFEIEKFEDISTYATNHLLKWCVEVLTAYEFDFFKKGDDVKRNELVDALHVNFEIDFMLGERVSYEMDHHTRLVYESFFRYDQDRMSFDDQMEQLLSLTDAKEEKYRKMAAFRESWSLQKISHDQNPTKLSSVQVEDTKLSADESQVAPPTDPISTVQLELVSNTTFEFTGVLGKRKSEIPKKESEAEKSKKHKAMTLNARRRAGGMHLTKGYLKMPRDRAVFQQWTGTYAPTIKINNSDEFIAFDLEFPPETRAHGFMISFKGETQYWNKTKKNFQTEVIKIKI